MSDKYTLILVPETHWDREWYLPFQEFRIKLVRLTDKLLKILDTDPEYKSFTFDGQTVVLEDYLEIRPQERERLKKYVAEDRILVGPWYILPDEFLVSAEATVRNLLMGHMIAEEFGRPMKAGYIPDPFGHISQLPQILQGFGIGDVFFTRGMGEEMENMNSEFWWEAPDGTRVMAVHLVNGYHNAMYLGKDWTPQGFVDRDDRGVGQIMKQIEDLSQKASTKFLLLNNGCDHVEPQPELPELITYINERLSNGEIIHGTYEDYAAAVLEESPDLKTYRGELHKGKYHPLLPGVFSARMYIKQANEETQTLLEKWAEPASAIAWIHGGAYENQLLWEAWKQTLKNHPHDSICGCSIDQVHREMMPRFDQARQIGETLTKESLDYLAANVITANDRVADDARALVVYNPHSWDATDNVVVHLQKELPNLELAPKYVVRDAEGEYIPAQVVNQRIVEFHRRYSIWHGDLVFTGQKVPSLGYKTYYLENGEYDGDTSLRVGPDFMENDHVRLTIRSNGTFDIVHRDTKTVFFNQNMLEDTEDVGDEYNYSYARNTQTVTSEGVKGKLTIVEHGPVRATVRADFTLDLPECATDDRLSRSEKTIPCPVSVFITLHAHSSRVDIRTEIENNAKDHRLRAWFPTGFQSDWCRAEGQYDVVKRSVHIPEGKDWYEKPVGQKPVQSYVAIDGIDAGLAVINKGLPEYEVIADGQCTIAQTLLRCVGWLSRTDLETRPYDVGPVVSTPEAQCLGKQVFDYAVFPYRGSWKKAHIWQEAHLHNAPMRTSIVNQHEGKLPREHSLVRVNSPSLIITAVKKAERSNALVARVLNTTPDAVDAELTVNMQFISAYTANLNEEPQDELSVSENKVTIPMPGFRVQTLLFNL